MSDLKTKIKNMQMNDGFYLCGDTDHPEAWVPITVKGGRIYSMLLDQIMSSDRFLDTATIAGPFNKDEDLQAKIAELEAFIKDSWRLVALKSKWLEKHPQHAKTLEGIIPQEQINE